MLIKTALNVNVEDVQKMIDYRDALNSMNFNDIVWLKNGKEVNIPRDIKEEFAYTGLSNSCFCDFFGEYLK